MTEKTFTRPIRPDVNGVPARVVIEPTAKQALEWLNERKLDVAFVDEGEWHIVEPMLMQVSLLGSGATPLEAIRNAMKGECDA